MKPEEIPQFIAEVALADPRVRREDPIERRAQARMWAGILASVPYDAALRYVHEHYARSQWPILPADIAARWHTTVRDRMERHTTTFEPTRHPDIDPDDIPAYQAALRAERHAVATGNTHPSNVRELTTGPAAAEVQARLAALGEYMPPHIRDGLAAYRPVRAEREQLAREGRPDPLNVPCTWCGARTGQQCRTRRLNPKTHSVASRTRRTPHPTRIEAAAQSHGASA